MKDFISKVNKKHIVIFSFIGILITIILYTRDRKDTKTIIVNDIQVNSKNKTLLDNVSVSKVDNELFKIRYILPKTEEGHNKISETVYVNFKNLNETSHDNKIYSFKNCDNQRKKYIIFLDISGSVKDKIGEDKYISELNHNLINIFEKTNLTIGDEIYINFIGENKDKGVAYEFAGPTFGGNFSKNSVYNKNTFTINSIDFFKENTKCSNKDNLLSETIQSMLEDTQKSFIDKIERKTKLNTYIGDSIKSIQSQVQSDKYSKIVYIMFTDGGDVSVPGKNDTGFSYCNEPNCGYDFINQTGNDEAHVFWVEKSHENKIKLLFNGIKLNLN
jgi:hypothetical protein